MSLTDSQCRGSKPGTQRFKLTDGRGLYLLVQPSGTKAWYHRYYFSGAQRDDLLGTYPEVTLAAARTKRDQARVELAAGKDPRGEPEAVSQGDRRRLFRNVAETWFDTVKRPRLEPRTAGRQWARLLGLMSVLGDKDIAEIGTADVLAALRLAEDRGAIYTARRLRGMVEGIFDFAHVSYGVEHNPATQKLIHALRPVPPTRNQPSLPFDAMPGFYLRLRGPRCLQAQDDTRTRLAVELVLHTALRTDELRTGRWDQIRGDEWHIPAEQMKKVNGVSRDHIVPLNTRALEILAELKAMARRSEFIFPGLRPGRQMSENTMGNWMKAQGYQDIATVHGFRTTFSTHCHESGLWDSEWIEVQLAHVDRDKVRGIYNKAIYLKHRRKMMEWWGRELAKQEMLSDIL